MKPFGRMMQASGATDHYPRGGIFTFLLVRGLIGKGMTRRGNHPPKKQLPVAEERAQPKSPVVGGGGCTAEASRHSGGGASFRLRPQGCRRTMRQLHQKRAIKRQGVHGGYARYRQDRNGGYTRIGQDQGDSPTAILRSPGKVAAVGWGNGAQRRRGATSLSNLIPSCRAKREGGGNHDRFGFAYGNP